MSGVLVEPIALMVFRIAASGGILLLGAFLAGAFLGAGFFFIVIADLPAG